MSYVEVPAEAIRTKLAQAGFVLDPTARGHEEVYVRQHRNPLYTIKVFSSIARDQTAARGCGQDAIRCVAIFTHAHGTQCVYKGKRVHRTGSIEKVLTRMIERARDAYAAVNDRLKGVSNVQAR